MKEYKASVINRILNFRRHVIVVAEDFHSAVEAAKHLLPGYTELEWCMLK